jgi:hypothetical protein
MPEKCEHCRQADAEVQVALRRPADQVGWFLSGKLCRACAAKYGASGHDVQGRPWTERQVLPL